MKAGRNLVWVLALTLAAAPAWAGSIERIELNVQGMT